MVVGIRYASFYEMRRKSLLSLPKACASCYSLVRCVSAQNVMKHCTRNSPTATIDLITFAVETEFRKQNRVRLVNVSGRNTK